MKTLIINAAQIATPIGISGKHGSQMNEISVIKNGAVYIEDGIIKKVGETNDIIKTIELTEDIEVIDASEKAIIPGFVDSHTHFILADTGKMSLLTG